MYLYQPVLHTIGDRIVAMRATQEANPHAAALRAAIPMRIPTRVIHADHVQRELTQQSEEELQQTMADIQRAANLGDPEIKPDSVIVARFLVKNNRLGGVVSQMNNLRLNNTGNKTTSGQQQNLTVYQRTALDNLTGTPPTTATPSLNPTKELNLSSFDINLPDGGLMKGMGQ